MGICILEPVFTTVERRLGGSFAVLPRQKILKPQREANVPVARLQRRLRQLCCRRDGLVGKIPRPFGIPRL